MNPMPISRWMVATAASLAGLVLTSSPLVARADEPTPPRAFSENVATPTESDEKIEFRSRRSQIRSELRAEQISTPITEPISDSIADRFAAEPYSEPSQPSRTPMTSPANQGFREAAPSARSVNSGFVAPTNSLEATIPTSPLSNRSLSPKQPGQVGQTFQAGKGVPVGQQNQPPYREVVPATMNTGVELPRPGATRVSSTQKIATEFPVTSPASQATVVTSAPRASASNAPAVPATPMSPPAQGVMGKEPSMLSEAFLQSVQPMIEIRQRMPETIRYGKPAPIELEIFNSGKVAVDNVTVVDDIPKEVELLESMPPARQEGTRLSWPLGKLQPGQVEVIRFNLKINATDPNWTLTHSARVQIESAVSGSTRVLRPMIELDVTGPDQGVVGEAVTYTINVSNVGNAPATRVILQDSLPNGLSHPYGPNLENELGELKIGESRKIQLTLTPSQVGEIVNRLVVRADDMPKVEQAINLKVQQVRLELAAEAPKVRYVNRSCEYSFTVTNKGKMETRQAELVARLPEGIAFAQATDGGKHSEIERCVAWEVTNLKPGESRTFVVKAIATQVGDQVCETVLTSQGEYRRESKLSTKVRGIPALMVEVKDLEDPIELGEETIYEIRLVNQGTLAATNVRIAIDIPAEIKPVAAEGPTRNRMTGSVLSFEPIVALEPQDEIRYRVKVRGSFPGDCRFRVTVESDQLSKPIVEEEATTVYRTEE